MLCELGAASAADVLADDEDQLRRVAANKRLTIPGILKAANEWGYTGSRVHGPHRAFSATDATTPEEHAELSRQLPFTAANGPHAPHPGCALGRSIHRRRGSGSYKDFRDETARKC